MKILIPKDSLDRYQKYLLGKMIVVISLLFISIFLIIFVACSKSEDPQPECERTAHYKIITDRGNYYSLSEPELIEPDCRRYYDACLFGEATVCHVLWSGPNPVIE